MQEIGKKCAQIELPWRWFDRYKVKEKKSDEERALDTFVVSQQTDFDSVNQPLYIGQKKWLPPQKNQSAREIQNWPTDGVDCVKND